MRVHNWQAQMLAVRDENRSRPRIIGEWDCWNFLALHIERITGIDYRSRFPQYTSFEEGQIILDMHGGAEGLLTSLLGNAKPTSFAQRGDAVVADFGEGVSPAVCDGIDSWIVAPNGLESFRTLKALMAWTVE